MNVSTISATHSLTLIFRMALLDCLFSRLNSRPFKYSHDSRCINSVTYFGQSRSNLGPLSLAFITTSTLCSSLSTTQAGKTSISSVSHRDSSNCFVFTQTGHCNKAQLRDTYAGWTAKGAVPHHCCIHCAYNNHRCSLPAWEEALFIISAQRLKRP